MNDAASFIIENSVLKGYKGTDPVVVVPDGVTSIGDNAISSCKSLRSITLPDSLTSIGHYAFWGCDRLSIINLPDSLTSIGDRAFGFCQSLISITLPDSLTSIGDSAFAYCENLSTITLPDSITSIGDSAFAYCENLSAITLPDSITSIGDNAFRDCIGLSAITLPDAVTSIGYRVFGLCKSLNSISLPDSLTSIGNYAFCDCSSLSTITLPEGVTSIGEGAFAGCKSLSSINIPKKTTISHTRTFRGCNQLADSQGFIIIRDILYGYAGDERSLTIPEGVVHIGGEAFAGHAGQQTFIALPESLKSVGNRAFRGCRSLEEIQLSRGLERIGEEAFAGCKKLSSVILPEGLTSLEKKAFFDCDHLVHVSLPASLAKVGDEAFAWQPQLTHLKLLDLAFFKGVRFDFNRPADSLATSERLAADVANRLSSLNAREFAYTYLYQSGKAWSNLFSMMLGTVVSCDEALTEMADALEKSPDKNRKLARKAVDFAEQHISRLETGGLMQLSKVLEEQGYAEAGKLKGLVMQSKEGQAVQAVHPMEQLVRDRLQEAEVPMHFMTAIKDPVHYAGSEEACSQEALGLLLYEYAVQWEKNSRLIEGPYGKYRQLVDGSRVKISRTADAIAAALNKGELRQRLRALAYSDDYRPFILAYARFMDEAQASLFIQDIRRSSVKNSWRQNAVNALFINETRAAMLFMDKKGLLYKYAQMRGMSEGVLRDTVLSDFGLDASGEKSYELGNRQVVVRMGTDLKLELYDPAAGKVVKSLPKRGSDPQLHAAALRDLADLRKNLKKVAKARTDALFQSWLERRTWAAREWGQIYQGSNPLFRQIAELLVWTQGKGSFCILAGQLMDVHGQAYALLPGEPVFLAHPMEMQPQEVAGWQEHFKSNKIKQPFAQVWEPVVDSTAFKEDRYAGVSFPLYRLRGQEKRGIALQLEYYSYDRRAGSRIISEVEIRLKHFESHFDFINADDPAGVDTLKVQIRKIIPRFWDRYTNHIITYLDKSVAYEMVLQDKAEVRDLLDSFTLAQLLDFIALAIKNDSTKVTALLLNYKNERHEGYDAMDELLLD